MTKSLEYGKCLETGKRQNPLNQQKRDSRGAPTDIGYGKCPETGKLQNPLITESVWKQENDKILWSQNRSVHGGTE